MSDGIIRAAVKNEGPAQVMIKPGSWIANIEFVKQLILTNNILISFLGEQGSGKTTFANILQAELPENVKPVMIVADPLIDAPVFLQKIGALLGMSSDPSIDHFIRHCNEQNSHTLLIIDDAHYLPALFLEEILDALLQQGKHGYFHVCLLSNFSMVSTYNKLAQNTHAEMIHTIELGSLSESETKTYIIQNLLKFPGADRLLTDDRIKQFYQLTAGHIEAVNRQMANFFNYKPTRLLNQFIQFRQLGLAAGIFLIATAGVYFWLSQDLQPPPPELASIAIAPPEAIVVAEPPALDSNIPSYDVAAMRQAVEATPLRRVDLTDDPQEDEQAANDSLVVMDKVVVAPKVVQVNEKQASPIIKKVTHTIAKVSVKPRTSAVVIKPALTQGGYTIQLLASQNKLKLQRFAAAHHLTANTNIHQTYRQGKIWYVLTLGVYPQRLQAKQAVNRLPRDIAQYRPWVRLLSELKAG